MAHLLRHGQRERADAPPRRRLTAVLVASPLHREDLFVPSLRNVVAGLTAKQFWSPGSTLRVSFDTSSPLAYGMPDDGFAIYLSGNPVYEIAPTASNQRVTTIATYADRDILQSGWLLGEGVIAKKAAMVSAQYGKGEVVMIGFRPQHRAQAHGTYKLVFNALLGERSAAR